jgi:hypothetical protein
MTSPKRRLAVAFSLANLAFVPSWLELLFSGADSGYYMKRLPGPQDFMAAILGVLILGSVFYGVSWLAEKKPLAKPLWLLCFLAAVAIPLNNLRLKLPREVGVGRILSLGPVWLALLGVIALALAYLAFRARKKLVPGALAFVAILAPFAALTVLRGGWAAATHQPDPRMVEPPLSVVTTSTSAPLAVWMIFDELDYRLGFEHRPEGLEMPEFDRLRAQSVASTRAIPPSNATLKSIPSLITGRVVADAEVSAPNELTLTIDGGKVPYSEQDNVFRRAQQMNMETGVVGWYHPYCRLLDSSLSHCSWWPVYQTVTGRVAEDSLFGSLGAQLAGLLPTNGRALHIASYENILRDAKRAVSEQKHGLLYLHLPAPHPPSVYDRHAQKTTVMSWSNVSGYIDNLALADRALGEIRAAMEAAGTWDRAIVVVTADHPWRQSKAFDGKKDERVPFLWKLPSQKTRLDHDAEVHTVVTGEILLELLSDPRVTPDGLSARFSRVP